MKAPRSAHVVVDLGFGDAGKGTLTDWLVRRHDARLVVRFNGGAQAGHNVVTDDGRHHTFSQLGAGSFVPGVATHLAHSTVFHPLALHVEAQYLADSGVPDGLARVTVSERARVITPFHQAIGRLRELSRGANRHGTCGVGVGETVRDALAHPEATVLAGDLCRPAVLLRKARAAQERLRAEDVDVRHSALGHPDAAQELALLEDSDIPSRWVEAVHVIHPEQRVVGDDWLGAQLRQGHTVFEGAQGVLLDEWRGFHPHTTWSTCTFEPALALLREQGFDGDVHRLGVLRAYATRHGEGPFPTEEPSLAPSVPEPHNTAEGWQGGFRVGAFDAVLGRYALQVCGGVDSLAVTHVDRLTPHWSVCSAYHAPPGPPEDEALVLRDAAGRITALRPGAAQDLAWQARLTAALARCTPEQTTLELGDTADTRTQRFVTWVEANLGVRVSVTSQGPRARDKRSRG
ncbi:adenylosuccinate synthetase [Myxococcus qinghaiensis]|uniref:adenylosuccinate synthetase n=1 Tax=Myxococcus qinghaiensis TaxID=2906758 RepID=UPI0020A6FBED|nr:adenylosuccinate synthetase [Myxococcus qinghaiensis]MCP3168726.1 adenylosuccinate synthetase [Myxococcus qinghaiensis]